MKTRSLVVLLLTTLACNGSSGGSGTGGSKASGGSGGGAAGAGGGGATGNKDAGPDGSSVAGAGGGGAPGTGGMGGATMAGAKRLVGGRARLVGGPVSACSQPSGNGEKWCAFTLPAAMPIGATELWVLNVSKAMTAEIPCDGTNPACLKLTSTLWTGAPMNGVVHPLAHSFSGETLIFYSGTTISMQPFNGPIFSWRPGWPQAKQLSGANGYSCEAHGSADSALCIEDIHLEANPPYFDVHAGKVNGNQLPLASRIYPTSSTGARVWSMAFSPAGDYFAYSTGGPMPADKETLYAWKIDEVGMAAKRVTVGNFAQWDIAADGKHWYFLRDYNYPPRNSTIEPSGTLMTADFPAGGNPVMLATQVGSYVLLGDGKGVAYLDKLTGGKGGYKFVKDSAKPTEVVTVATDVMTALVSPDLRYSLVQTQFAAGGEVGDAIIIKNDGTGRCPLAMGTTSTSFGASFLEHSGRVFWADNVSPTTLEGEGWIANPDGCTEKQKFGDKVDFWFLSGDSGLIFSDNASVNTASLKFAKVGAGFPAAGATTIRMNVGRVYAPLGTDRNHIVYQVADGGPDDGIYVYGPIGF
jgi:hypothetical protein